MPWIFLAQQTDAVTQWPEIAREYGAVAVLIVVVVFTFRAWKGGWFYSRTVVEKIEASWEARLKDMTSERNTWRDLALNGTDMARRAIRMAAEQQE